MNAESGSDANAAFRTLNATRYAALRNSAFWLRMSTDVYCACHESSGTSLENF